MLNWIGMEKNLTSLRCPPWVYKADIPFRPVHFSSSSEFALSSAIELRTKKLGAKTFTATHTLNDAKLLVTQVLHFLSRFKLVNMLSCDVRFYSKTSGVEV